MCVCVFFPCFVYYFWFAKTCIAITSNINYFIHVCNCSLFSWFFLSSKSWKRTPTSSWLSFVAVTGDLHTYIFRSIRHKYHLPWANDPILHLGKLVGLRWRIRNVIHKNPAFLYYQVTYIRCPCYSHALQWKLEVRSSCDTTSIQNIITLLILLIFTEYFKLE